MMAANVFIARGQPSRALEILAAHKPQIELVHTGAWWDSSIVIEVGDTEPIAWAIEVLGSCGANRPELRTALDSLWKIWSAPRHTQDEIEALAAWYTDDVEPALLLLGDDAIRDWFSKRSAIPDMWGAYLKRETDSLAAMRWLEQAAAKWLDPSLYRDPTTYYLRANVAQALGRDSLAVEVYRRMDPLRPENRFASSMPYSVLSSDARWSLLSHSYLKRARSYEALGDTANAIKYYERFVEVWADAEPDLQHYADEAREGLTRLGGAVEPAE